MKSISTLKIIALGVTALMMASGYSKEDKPLKEHKQSKAVAASLVGVSPVLSGCPTVLNTKLPRLQDEKLIDVCSLNKKVTLVVNTASKCGFTQQYEQLETLHQKYSSKGLVILGFPTGDFSNQEHKTNTEIASFCKNTFGIEFPMFSKSTVKSDSPQINPLFKNLYKLGAPEARWNFNKYLILQDGSIHYFDSMVNPLNSEIEKLITEDLASKK